MECLYLYSYKKKSVISVKEVSVFTKDDNKALYRIITSNDEILYEVRKYPLKIYRNKNEVEEEK